MSNDELEKFILAGCVAIIASVVLLFAMAVIVATYEVVTCRSFDQRASGEMVCTERRI